MVKTKELTTLICGVIVDTIEILVVVVGVVGNVDARNPIREPKEVLKVSWGVLFAVVGASTAFAGAVSPKDVLWADVGTGKKFNCALYCTELVAILT